MDQRLWVISKFKASGDKKSLPTLRFLVPTNFRRGVDNGVFRWNFWYSTLGEKCLEISDLSTYWSLFQKKCNALLE